ncbi:hypothetical protein MKX03_006557 [Papaver bracteatum]|nr:hypothetical protein MKX03_006557 [Papaver bracteatum]
MRPFARVSHNLHSKRKGYYSSILSRYGFVFGASILIVTAIIVLLVSFFSPSIINPVLQNNLDQKFTFIPFDSTVSPSWSSAPELVNSSDQTNQKLTPTVLFKEILSNSTETISHLKVVESVTGDKADSNVTSPSRFSSNGNSRSVSRKRRKKSQKKTSSGSRLNDETKKKGNGDDCNIFDGEWVWVDNRKPYYPPGSCPFIEEGSNFNCFKNGKTDDAYLNWQWQWQSQETNPRCNDTIPRVLNATDFLEKLRGKKVVLAGDSMNRNMFSSLACILWNAATDKSKVFRLFEGGLLDYNCTVRFVWSAFLVYETQPQNSRTQESILKQEQETLRLDLIDPHAALYYPDADIVVFDSWHWWVGHKVHNGTNYFQEGDYLHPQMDVRAAYKKALTTWSRWIDKNINPNKTQIIFREHSISHYIGSKWNKDGKCNRLKAPLMNNETFIEKNPSEVKHTQDTIRRMKTPVIYLDVAKQTYYRVDAHPSMYTSSSNKNNAKMKIDCGHWCLPGVPDTWNELLYISLVRAGKGSFARSK